MSNDEVATRIKNIRLNRGLTLEEFGEILGATKVSVHNWESGRNLPNNERLKRITELGNTTVGELLYQKSKEEYELKAHKAFADDLQRVSNEFDLRQRNANSVVRELRYLLNSLNETLGEINKEEQTNE